MKYAAHASSSLVTEVQYCTGQGFLCLPTDFSHSLTLSPPDFYSSTSASTSNVEVDKKMSYSRILRGIDDDAATITSRSTRRSTIAGIGEFSGKALKAFGEILIEQAEMLRMNSRLRSIRVNIDKSSPELPALDCRDLLELQRSLFQTRK